MKPVKIKILQRTSCYPGIGGEIPWLSGYDFTDDPKCEDYDWLVVYDEFSGEETLRCPREHTILCTWEPVSIKDYPKQYAWQFGHLLTNRSPEAEKHPHYRLGRGYFYWFNARPYHFNVYSRFPNKTKDVSMVCSAKQMRHTQHYSRYQLALALANGVEGLDWFGKGVRPIEKKTEALDSYRYHVAVENHIAPHHWTEKLADALLSECLPFYAGDPAIAEVLPSEAIIPIPLDNSAEAVAIVNRAVAGGEYERRREAVLEAKQLILKKYNFWMQVVELIEAEAAKPFTPPDLAHPQKLYSRQSLRWHSPVAAMNEFWLHLKRGF